MIIKKLNIQTYIQHNRVYVMTKTNIFYPNTTQEHDWLLKLNHLNILSCKLYKFVQRYIPNCKKIHLKRNNLIKMHHVTIFKSISTIIM